MAVRRRSGLIIVWVVIGVATAFLFPIRSSAQGPQCPPGFVFDRLSGVGCVQENCGQISGSHFSYTGSCICNDDLKGCYEPVDYGAFSQDQCGPFCPFSSLTSCIALDAACPGEVPAGTAPGQPAQGGLPEGQVDSPGAPGQAGGDQDSRAEGGASDAGEPSIKELTRILEEALVAKEAQKVADWRAGAASLLAALGVLIFLVSLLPPSSGPALAPVPGLSGPAATAPGTPATPVVEPPVEQIYDWSPGRILFGDQARRYLENTGALSRLSKLRHGADWDSVIDAMHGDPGKTAVNDFAINWKDDGAPDLDDLVIVVPETQPPTSPPDLLDEPETPGEAGPPDKPEEAKPPEAEKKPPDTKKPPPEVQKPPDLKELLERARQEREQALARKVALLLEAIQLSQQFQRTKLEWDHTRVKAVTDGVVDIGDVVTDIRGVEFLVTKTFGDAYKKDLKKNILKNLLASGFTYLFYGDQATQLAPDFVLEELQKPSGLLTFGDLKKIWNDPSKARDYLLDVQMPGGGMKQLMQNRLEEMGEKGISKWLGPVETGVKAVRDASRAADRCAELRAQMVKIQERLGQIRSGMEDAQMDYEVADSAVNANEANLAELKKMFPHRFAND